MLFCDKNSFTPSMSLRSGKRNILLILTVILPVSKMSPNDKKKISERKTMTLRRFELEILW